MNMAEQNEPMFTEVQRFRQLWIWLLTIISAVAMLGIVGGLVVQRDFATLWQESHAGMIVSIMAMILVALGLPILFYATKLITEVHPDGIYVRFVPFHLSYRKMLFADLKSYEARAYSPLGEYGGWGIRYGAGGKRNMAYNVSGNRGVQLEFKDGRRLLIGSQKPDELVRAIDAAFRELNRGDAEERS